jgi:hypothetical protein
MWQLISGQKQIVRQYNDTESYEDRSEFTAEITEQQMDLRNEECLTVCVLLSVGTDKCIQLIISYSSAGVCYACCSEKSLLHVRV